MSHEEYDLAKQALRKVNNYSRKDMDFSKSVYYCGHCGRRLRRTYGKTTYLSCQTGMYQKEAECRKIRLTLPEMEETKAAYERYQQEKSERQEFLGRYAIEEELTREEMLKLMYQGVDKVLVYVDGTVEMTWKFQDVFVEVIDKIAEKEEDIAGKWAV